MVVTKVAAAMVAAAKAAVGWKAAVAMVPAL